MKSVQVALAVFLVLFCSFAESKREKYTLLDDDQIVEMLEVSCNFSTHVCPKRAYAIGAPWKQDWDYQAVFDSRAVELFRLGRIPAKFVYPTFRHEFCCTIGPCLEECNLLYKFEKSIVKAFPQNAEAIFSLGIPDLERFRPAVDQYVAEYGDRHTNDFTAELEEFFDTIHENSHLIYKLLARKAAAKHRLAPAAPSDL